MTLRCSDQNCVYKNLQQVLNMLQHYFVIWSQLPAISWLLVACAQMGYPAWSIAVYNVTHLSPLLDESLNNCWQWCQLAQ